MTTTTSGTIRSLSPETQLKIAVARPGLPVSIAMVARTDCGIARRRDDCCRRDRARG